MSEEPSRFADAEQQIEQMQAVLDQAKHALEAIDRAEAAAREAAQHGRTATERVTIAAAIILAAVVLGRVTMSHHHR